jgi:hypothetical protein
MFFFGFNISLFLFIKRIGQFINHIITVYYYNFMLIYKFNLTFNQYVFNKFYLLLIARENRQKK